MQGCEKWKNKELETREAGESWTNDTVRRDHMFSNFISTVKINPMVKI